MAPAVMETLLQRLPPSQPAVLVGYTRHPVIGALYPGMIAAKQNDKQSTEVVGLVYRDLTEREMKILDWFEDVQYTRYDVSVRLISKESGSDKSDSNDESKKETTQTYVWTYPHEQLQLESEWDSEAFCKDHLEYYLENVVRPCQRSLKAEGLL
jgi:Gamma-glutamyl cyclotransferase, AIG2-like